MKKLINYLLLPLMLLSVVFTACKDDETNVPPYASLTVDSGKSLSDIALTKSSATIVVKVESNAAWKAEVTPDVTGGDPWIIATPPTGEGNGAFTVVVAPNTTTQERTAVLKFYLEGKEEKSVKISQSADEVFFMLSDDFPDLIPAEGATVAFEITCNATWTYEVTPAEGVTEIFKHSDALVLKFPTNETADEVSYSIVFDVNGRKSYVTIKQEAKPVPEIVADLLDVQFLADGTAVDASPAKHTIETVPGAALVTYYNEDLGQYVANFRHALGGVDGTGFYRVPYTAGDAFISDIADGCTIESIFRLQVENPGTAEVKWFSSVQSGGMGLILPLKSRNNSITFLPNLGSGSNVWCWTHSNVYPEVGKFYHVVGVYDKDKNESRIYVNGELCNTVIPNGTFTPVAAGAEYFCIGGDANVGKTCESALNGEIVSAKIYSQPLSDDEVAAVFTKANLTQSTQAIALSDLQFLPMCNVGPGYGYVIYGNGFQSGDVIEMQSLNNEATKYTPAVNVGTGKVTLTIPTGLASGYYRMMLRRGTTLAPIGTAQFTYSSTPRAYSVPKIIAHRGIHDTSARTENSCASLRAAMDFGAYGSELDVHITTDGRVVVHHDGVMNGVTIQNSTYDNIKNFTLANGEKLPTFDQMIEIVKEKRASSPTKLIVEFKTGTGGIRAVDAVLALVKAAGIEDRVEYISFGYDVCKHVLEVEPTAIVGYLAGDKEPSVCIADGIKSIDYNSGVLYNKLSWITDAQARNMIVNVWTINTASDMLNFIGLGVDYITTDQCALLKGLNDKQFIVAQ